MSCRYRNNESYYCQIKCRVINPEDLVICEDCSYYETDKKQKIFCSDCEKEFDSAETSVVLVKGKEFPKCPHCGKVIGIKKNDEMLR